MGFLDDRGTFVEKAEVSAKGPTIVVRKVNPKEKFSSLSLRFTFPGARKPGAMRGVFIQWEKRPRRMGRRWPLNAHRRFDLKSATLKTSWTESLAFMLLDKSGKRLFAGRSWDRNVEIRLEGRLLKTKPPVPAPQAKMTAEADPVSPVNESPATPVAPVAPAPAARPEAAPAQPPAEPESSLYHSLNEVLQRQEDLKKELNVLSHRVSEVEHAVVLAQRWFYWGPLLALTLSILFSSVALFLTFIRLSRTRNIHNMPSSRYGKAHLSSQDRFRRMG